LRILLINTRHYLGGGDSTYTFNLADLLRSKGHTVAFFAMQDERNIFDPNADLFVSYIDFKELNKNKNLLNGLRIIRRIIYSTEARKKFSLLLKRFHPDIIHLQNIQGHITPSIIFEAKKYGIPVVWTLHDYKLICPNSHFLIDYNGTICEACGRISYYKAVFKRCKKGSILASAMAAIEAYAHRLMKLRNVIDFFLSPSKFLKEKMLERKFPVEKIKHLPLFLPDNMFYIENIKENYLLFFGRIDPIKGIYPLIEASKQMPEINIILAGRVIQPISSQLDRILPSNVNYIGMKHGEELMKIILKSSAVILPSLWYENQPFSILEAFAVGKPVIASNLGGMSELINNSKGGILVPPGDISALAKAMRWILTHEKQAEQMGSSAREYAAKEHSAQIHYERLMHIYKKCVG